MDDEDGMAGAIVDMCADYLGSLCPLAGGEDQIAEGRYASTLMNESRSAPAPALPFLFSAFGRQAGTLDFPAPRPRS